MSLFVKLCGIRDRDALEAAIEAGADAVGIVMAESPRQVGIVEASSLVSAATGRIKSIGVFYHPTREELEIARDEIGFDWIQAETESLAGVDGIISMPVVHGSKSLIDEVDLARSESGSGLVLVEGAGKGGRGISPDRSVLGGLADMSDLVIAGGLSPAIVGEVVRSLRPGGVDVSSGVERAPGVKDYDLMRDFVDRARESSRKVFR